MKKGYISEDDTIQLSHRYSATTVLALLQEVSQSAGAKIDWNSLVKKTTTGISNVREYQMLWRHLAYRDTLVDKVEKGDEPLNDDSDLEYELEPTPSVSVEASTEAAAAVKVLMSNESGSTNRSFGEALTGSHMSNGQILGIPSEALQNLDGRPSVSTMSSSEGLDGNGSTAPRRKRKLWTPEEDMELIAAVQKCGEGNWANILKGDFKHERTASQLSQRWAIIRKRKANSSKSTSTNQTGTTLSEAQLATRQAVSIALNMPMMGSLSAVGTSNTSNTTTTSEQESGTAQACKVPPCPPKHRPLQKKLGSALRYSIQEAAVAAGARIATPSTAASLLKAAQSKNAVHIKQGDPLPPIGPRPSTVHYIRAGSAVVPTLSRSGNAAAIVRPTASGQLPLPGASVQSEPLSRPDTGSKVAPPTVECATAPSEEQTKDVKDVESSAKTPAGSMDVEEALGNKSVEVAPTKVAGEDENVVSTCTDMSETCIGEHRSMTQKLADESSSGTESQMKTGGMECSINSEVEDLVMGESEGDILMEDVDENRSSVKEAGSAREIDEEQRGIPNVAKAVIELAKEKRRLEENVEVDSDGTSGGIGQPLTQDLVDPTTLIVCDSQLVDSESPRDSKELEMPNHETPTEKLN